MLYTLIALRDNELSYVIILFFFQSPAFSSPLRIYLQGICLIISPLHFPFQKRTRFKFLMKCLISNMVRKGLSYWLQLRPGGIFEIFSNQLIIQRPLRLCPVISIRTSNSDTYLHSETSRKMSTHKEPLVTVICDTSITSMSRNFSCSTLLKRPVTSTTVHLTYDTEALLLR